MKKIIRKIKSKVSATRMTFLSVACVVAIGNTLTGWGIVSWVLWIPPIALSLAAITGVCPFKIIFEKLGFAND
jgi:hypothetical protein